MRNRALLLAIHLWLLPMITATAQEIFQRTIDLRSSLRWTTAQETAPGRFIVLSTHDDTTRGIRLVSFRKDGTVIFSKFYSSSRPQNAYVFANTSSRYFIGGSIELSGPKIGYLAAVVIATDTLGNVRWTRSFGLEGYSFFLNGIVATSDGGVIAVGSAYEFSSGYSALFSMRISGDGNLRWGQLFDTGDSTSMATGIAESDGAWIITGSIGGRIIPSTGEKIGLPLGGLVVKLRADGTVIWSKALGENGSESTYCVAATSDGGCLVGGSTRFKSDSFPLHPAVVHLNSAGEILWARSLAFTPRPSSNVDGVATASGGNRLAVLTASYDLYPPSNAMQLTLLEADGTLAFSRGYGADSIRTNNPQRITQSENGFIVADRVGNTQGGGTMVMIHTDAEGRFGCKETANSCLVRPIVTQIRDIPLITTTIDSLGTLQENTSTVSSTIGMLCDGLAEVKAETPSAPRLQLRPDLLPRGGQASLILPAGFSGTIELTITDVTGARISHTTIENRRETMADEIPIDTWNLSPGMYLVAVKHGKTVLHGKFIVR